MPLPSRMIDALFTRLLVRYGVAWSRLWDELPLDAVKADWAEQLDGMTPAAMAYAVENLPSDRPPATANAFKAISINRPTYYTRAIGSPKADPERVKAELERMRAFKAEQPPQAWAKTLQEREKGGDRLTETERTMWRAALNANAIEPGPPMRFNPIPDEKLPPAMRKGAHE